MSSTHAKAVAVVEQVLINAGTRHADKVAQDFAPALQRLTAANSAGTLPKRRSGAQTPLQQLQHAKRAAIAAGLPEAEEQALREFIAKAVPAPVVVLDPATLPRWHLDVNGSRLPDDQRDGIAMVHFHTIGIIIDARTPPSFNNAQQAHEYAATVDLLGRKGDWVIGTDHETALIVDRDFAEPAVNPSSFPNFPKSGRVYTSRPYKGSKGCVWFVSLCYGSVGWDYDDLGGFAVPVLRVPVSQ